ncbi:MULTISPECIES: hypothetical protein [unclassified Streptomyces]|uniref:hypothetical protein n=1 Tax=unclassified Streptomyces TaxID=2593676 RepID=UPI0033A59F74
MGRAILPSPDELRERAETDDLTVHPPAHRPPHGAVTMRIVRLTPDQAEAAGRMLARALDWLRQLREQLAAAAHRVLEALRPVVRLAQQLHPALARPDRPAWASPSGPPPRRH